VPIHGEWQHLVGHAEIGKRAGLPGENIFLLENGDVLVYEKKKASLESRNTALKMWEL